MRLVDLSHPWNMHTPAWVGYVPPKIYYWQTISSSGINAQAIETTLHIGTHLDSQMHAVPGGRNIGDYDVNWLYGDAAIVDISGEVEEWGMITPEMLTSQEVEIKKGDILIYHTGYHHHYVGGDKPDDFKYMCKHPGGYTELADWLVDMEIRWTAFDCGSGDHPMNTHIAERVPHLAAEFEDKVGKKLEEVFPRDNWYVMHKTPFAAGCVHVENMGGDIDEVLNRRCKVGCFPWRFDGGEGAMCRLVAFIED
ncbi:MAG: cyclase family protein [Nitrospinota bacterium]|jgi:kynurenine formamidase|nr:cyclase family protein [Nitrospinota bacterium]